MGAPPTGKSFSIDWMAVYRFQDGKIAERWLQADDLGMMAQLGFVQLPGAGA
jgi:predicted ester cyclase